MHESIGKNRHGINRNPPRRKNADSTSDTRLPSAGTHRTRLLMNEEPPTLGQAVGLRHRHAIQTGHRTLKNHAHPSGQRQLATSEQGKQHTPGHHANPPPRGSLTPPVYLVQTLPETYPAWGALCLPSAAISLLQEQIPAAPPSPARKHLSPHPVTFLCPPYSNRPD